MPGRLWTTGLERANTPSKPGFDRHHLPANHAALSSVPEYTTLSHRWGDGEYYKLTSEAFERFQAGVLCKTFQEAIDVARSTAWFEVYMDRCIHCAFFKALKKTGSEKHLLWETYGNGGLFRTRLGTDVMPPEFVGKKHLGKLSATSICYQKLWFSSVDGFPLLKRAWVIQERMLATRTLYFGENQLSWECNEIDCYEMYPRGLPKFMLPGQRIGRPGSGNLEYLARRVGDVENLIAKWESKNGISRKSGTAKSDD